MRVRVGHAQHGQRATEPIDVRLLPRLTRHEVFRDNPGFGCLTGLEVGVGQVDLRLVHRRLESAVDADLNELQ